MSKILIASSNKHKVDKLKQVLSENFSEILSLQDVNPGVEIEENGLTFLSNAILKAQELSRVFDGYVIATDAGAVIPGLGENWNALHTKRFAGLNMTDEDRVIKILEMMDSIEDRRIQMTEAFAICLNGETVFTYEAQSPEGIIVREWDGRVRKNAWPLSLWYLPNRGKMFLDLTEEELKEEENTWKELKISINAWYESLGK